MIIVKNSIALSQKEVGVKVACYECGDDFSDDPHIIYQSPKRDFNTTYAAESRALSHDRIFPEHLVYLVYRQLVN